MERLIDPPGAIATAVEAYRRHASGLVPKPARLDLRREAPKGGVLVLAGHSHDRLFIVKANAHAYPEANASRRNAASLLVLWDAVACVPLALIATTGFNNHRTAAGFAAAARALASPDSRTLAVFGAGKIAPAVIAYLATVLSLERVLIAGRDLQRATALATAARQWPGFRTIAVEATADSAEAARAADVIVTVTTSDQPVFPGATVRPGTLIVLGGANRPDAREADDTLISRARIFVDHLDGCLERAGDLAIPLASGALTRERIAGEVGSLLSGALAREMGEADVTVFKSIGIATQDLLLAHELLIRAERNGVGALFDPQGGGLEPAITCASHLAGDVEARRS